MYPVAEPELSTSIPEGWNFWTPKPSEIDAEGFGYFHEGLDLRGTTAKSARSYLATHLSVFEFISSKANSTEEFDDRASFFEDAPFEDDEYLEDADYETREFTSSNDCDLGLLELGVGAVAYALSAARMFPAASCRSHSNKQSWAPYPVIYLAASRPRAELLEKLVIESDCGFVVDPARSDLLVVAAPSLPQILSLANRIVENLSAFRSLTSRENVPKKPANPYLQRQLF